MEFDADIEMQRGDFAAPFRDHREGTDSARLMPETWLAARQPVERAGEWRWRAHGGSWREPGKAGPGSAAPLKPKSPA
jgi:hypothetical protein